ncbi:MAG: hypothetical protein PHR35_08635 [Kiritimatiellae bacterium]|nr:hypothetical protein [Kiritimatiellia bacterium]
MKVLSSGHRYELASFEGRAPAQVLQFIEKRHNLAAPPAFHTVVDGTTNEEVLAVLIDRMVYLQAKCPCRENVHAIEHMQMALGWLERRTTVRKTQGVEGTDKPHKCVCGCEDVATPAVQPEPPVQGEVAQTPATGGGAGPATEAPGGAPAPEGGNAAAKVKVKAKRKSKQ